MFSGDLFLSTAVRAPLTEETAKGLFFLVVLMSTRRGAGGVQLPHRRLVYAGLIGAGFSFTEDILYISGTANVGDAIQLSVIRVVLGGFGHMLYTGCVAVGFWLAMRSRGVLAKVAWILAGWLVGMLLHGLHNAATAVGALYFLVLGFDFLVFVALVIAAIWSSIREGKVVARQLPAMVDHGWIHASDAGWLGSTAGRKSRAKIMKRTPPAGTASGCGTGSRPSPNWRTCGSGWTTSRAIRTRTCSTSTKSMSTGFCSPRTG